jgi:hypothetical protein
LSGEKTGDYSVLQKIHVECTTCGASDSFYSNLSVEQFKSRHRGHDVVVEGEKSSPSAAYVEKYAEKPAPAEAKPRVEEAVYAVKPPPKEEEPLVGEAMTRISKVRVDLVVFPVLPEPVFRLRGFKDDGEEAFITTVRSEHAAKVREIIAGGEYVDHDLSGVRYSWEPEAVEYGTDARERLGLPAVATKAAKTSRPRPEHRQSPPETDVSTVAKTNEILFGESRKVDGAPAKPELPSLEAVAAPAPRIQLEAPPAPPPSPQPHQEKTPEREVEAQPSVPRQAVKKEEKKAVQPAAQLSPTKAAEEKEEGYLLVSKSWYIQGGQANRKEALRISQVLKEFRWKVEPVYTIGVILDDMLSIETNRNQISRTLITRVENAGYRLTAVTTEQGKPVAWFKRSAPEKLAAAGSSAVPDKPAHDEAVKGEESPSSAPSAFEDAEAENSLPSSPGDSDAGLEPDVTG